MGQRKTRGLTTRLVRVGRPAILIRAREEAVCGPEPQAGKRWCRRGVEGAGPYIRARSGVPPVTHHQVSRGDKPPPGTDGILARDVMLDACSPGEVRAISGPVADGRVREQGGGALILHSTARVTHRTDPGTACEALGQKRPWSAWATLGLGVSVRGESMGLGARVHGPDLHSISEPCCSYVYVFCSYFKNG